LKFLLSLLFILAVAAALSLAAQFNAGFVLFVYPPWRVELSLNLFLLSLVVFLVVMYVLARLVSATLAMPGQVREFRARRRADKGNAALREALQAFFEGRYGKAEKSALAAVEYDAAPGVAALLAARAAHGMKASTRRDGHYALAERVAPGLVAARLMTQAELLLYQHRHEEALEALKALEQAGSLHTGGLRLMMNAYQQAERWDQVLYYLGQLEKRDAIDTAIAEQLRIKCHAENLRRKSPDLDGLRQYWQKMPEKDRLNAKVAAAGASAFMDAGDCVLAVATISASLEHNWDNELVKLYGLCGGGNRLKSIEQAEKWLVVHPQDPGLLLALGRLCACESLWGKAESYLEASLSVGPLPETHMALAQLLEKRGRADEACRHYRESALLLSGAA
jgi:HemY protein